MRLGGCRCFRPSFAITGSCHEPSSGMKSCLSAFSSSPKTPLNIPQLPAKRRHEGPHWGHIQRRRICRTLCMSESLQVWTLRPGSPKPGYLSRIPLLGPPCGCIWYLHRPQSDDTVTPLRPMCILYNYIYRVFGKDLGRLRVYGFRLHGLDL